MILRLLVLLLIPFAATARQVVPWGDVRFLDDRLLLLPYAELERLGPEEIARERARRRAWLSRPLAELVEELVPPEPGEDAALFRFRRRLAEAYLSALKADPEGALDVEEEMLAELGLVLLRAGEDGLEPVARRALFQGRVPLSARVTSRGGLGEAARRRWTTPMVNLFVRVVAHGHRLAAWSWPEVPRGEGRGLVLDAETLDPLLPLGAARPVAWLGRDELLLLAPEDSGFSYLRARLLPAAGGGLRLFGRRPYGPASGLWPSGVEGVALGLGEPRLVLVAETPARLRWIDLASGRMGELRAGGGRRLWLSPYGGLEARRGVGWLVQGPRRALLRIEAEGGRPRLAELALPRLEGRFCGPLAVSKAGVLLCRDPDPRGTSGEVELWLYDPGTRRAERLALAPIPALGLHRPAGLSPDGRLLALRRSPERVELWSLVELRRGGGGLLAAWP